MSASLRVQLPVTTGYLGYMRGPQRTYGPGIVSSPTCPIGATIGAAWSPATYNLGMIDNILTGTGALSAVSGLVWWLRHDGPVRLYAGITAVRHPDRARRRDARAVLDCTSTETRHGHHDRRHPGPE